MRAVELRADAQLNRDRVVQAARQAFATEGTSVSMAEIARRAGVGFATAQRRFPTKESLIREVVGEQLAGIGELAWRGGEVGGRAGEPDGGGGGLAGRGGGLAGRGGDSVDDPWDAFATPIRACCAHQASEPGLAGALAQVLASVTAAGVRDVVEPVFTALAEPAKTAGKLRNDVTFDDVLLILKANAGVVANSPGREAEESKRFVELALSSLRSGGS
ncbi:TetR/AcrR family transcriptional regulator [Actinosynnema sp. CS-041913]|uniref:TetR/AcrR family transcriptional regulator n=1 Tax=Actinosynnema sp. CS-041913 TaxID=3239917 RepID=UPI003D8E6C40